MHDDRHLLQRQADTDKHRKNKLLQTPRGQHTARNEGANVKQSIKTNKMKPLIFLLLLLSASLLSAQHAATRSVSGGHNQARSVRSEAKKYGVKADTWNWVIPAVRKSDWYAYPIVGQVRDARMKLVYFYDKCMTRNPSDYYYIDEYANFIVLRWIPKDRVILQRE